MPSLDKKRVIARTIASCLDSPNGQVLLKHLKREYNDKPGFEYDKDFRMDVNALVANEGARSVYLALETIVESYRNGELNE